MPTAMPDEPFASRLGNAAGSTPAPAAPVVVGAKVDRLLLETIEHVGGGGGDARFGIARGGRVIAVDVAEVALAVDERIAHREVLREPASAS